MCFILRVASLLTFTASTCLKLDIHGCDSWCANELAGRALAIELHGVPRAPVSSKGCFLRTVRKGGLLLHFLQQPVEPCVLLVMHSIHTFGMSSNPIEEERAYESSQVV